MEYPHCLPTFIEGIDDGQMAVRELQAESRSWRAEKYAADSNLLVLEHIDGEGKIACYNDAQIDQMLKVGLTHSGGGPLAASALNLTRMRENRNHRGARFGSWSSCRHVSRR